MKFHRSNANAFPRYLWLLPVWIFLAALPVYSVEDATPTLQRIISMAPSTTEILFELGLGDKVVGVTRYCDYPPDATAIAKVGGYVDPNYEEILSLQPDLVILLTSHQDAKRELTKMGIRTATIPHKTVGDIHEAILTIGETCHARKEATALLKEIDRRAEAIRRKVKDKPTPSVLICIGRDTESGQLAGMYMAGKKGFYDEIIEAAGGRNAYEDEAVAYPQLSAEGVIELNPDVIVDLASHINPNGKTADEISSQWDRLRPVAAVRGGRVHVILGNHALRPGPRYVQFLEQLARFLHPDAFIQKGSEIE
jgi:iron complex transport system substrate-binding protein